jgi:putative oxidoreductase
MRWIFGDYVGGRGAVGLLIVRLVFGAGIMLHGWQKLNSANGPLQWMGPNGPPAFLQGLAVLAEFGGGIAMIIGLLMPLAMLGLTCNMLVALFMVHIPHGDPFVGKPGSGSFEPAAGYLAVALCLLIAGPGCLSLDALIFRPLFGKRKDVETS